MGRRILRRGSTLSLFLAALLCPSAALAVSYDAYNMWGSCGQVPGLFDLPTGIALDASGNVYVVARNNDWVQKFTNSGQFITSWTLPGEPSSPTPFAVEVDGGHVYVADGGNDRIVKYTTDGDYVTQWGSYGDGDGEFSTPIAIATGPDHSVYVADLDNNRVQKFTPDGVYLTQWGPSGGNQGDVQHPRGLVTDDDGNVYVTQSWMIHKYTSEGVYITTFGGPNDNGSIVDIDRDADGNFYLCDQFFHRIAKYSPDWSPLGSFGSFGSGWGQWRYPEGVAVDAGGEVFVADYQNCRVVTYVPCPFPVVTDQPEPLALPYGATAVFSVEALNAISYQWIRDDNAVVDNARISGATTSTLTINDFQESDLGNYWCVVQNLCGQGNQSAHVALSLGTAPSCFGIAATPPTGMAAWWAMDPGVGNTTPDVLHPVGNKNHASLTGAAALVAGKVGTAVRCDGLDDGLHVPSTLSPRLAAASTGLSIDAWILPRSGSAANANRMILQKGLLRKQTTTAGGVTALAPGYAFYLCNDGRLGFQMPDPDYVPVRFEPAMPAVSMDEWHHVAVTVDPLAAGGGKFYVDGVQVASFTAPSGILGNLADLYVGRFTPQWGPEFPASAFNGDIDEVEVFVTAIDSSSVRKIWSAGCTGKRRVQVLASSVASIREGTASAEICFAVQNLSSSARNYSWSIAVSGPGAGCSSSVPVGFTASSGSVSVPAGQRADLSTTASVDPSALASAFTRCYQLTVTDLADAGEITASGRLTFSGEHISAHAACTPPEIGDNFATFGEAQVGTGTATFTLFNDGPTGATVAYSVGTRDPETGGPSSVIRLEGAPAGTPWTGSLFVPAFGSAPLPVNVALDEHEPFLAHEVVLAVDPGGNSTYDEIATTHVAASDDTSLALVNVTPDAGRPARAFSLHAAPNPFGGVTAFTFTLAQAARVELDVVDVAGRRVRRVFASRLEAGEQRVPWDGRDDRGARLPAGIYLGRVRAGNATAVVRLLRMR